MKIKSIEVKLIWEDGTSNDVSTYLPLHLQDMLETFSNWWEERYGEDDKEEEEERVMIDLEPHSFIGKCLDKSSNEEVVKHSVTYTVNNVDRTHIVMATDPMDAIKKTKDYLKGETK